MSPLTGNNPIITTMIDHSNSNISKLAVHYVGNKTNAESLVLSNDLMDISDPRLRELLLSYFLGSFKSAEYYSFTSTTGDLELNPVYTFAKKIFDGPKTFAANSINLAKHLYEVALHPQIKSGDFFVVHIAALEIDGETTDAIGIYKSENRQSFLKVSAADNTFRLQYDDGIDITKIDKGCLIFHVEGNDGYKIVITDKVNKTEGAQYWKDLFLMVKPASNEFNHTRQLMNIAKDYVTKQYVNEFDVTKTDQIDLLNRSVDYFKKHDTYDRKEFEEEVLHHPEMIKSFQSFNDQYSVKNEIDIADNFSISAQAVNKQARIFKSVLKLDKNFHIYIHGHKDLIEKGTDRDGRKYYKIYYESES